LYYPGETSTDSDVSRAQRIADESTGCRILPSKVVRLEHGHAGDASVLNALMMDSFLDHDVDLFLVLFSGSPPEQTRLFTFSNSGVSPLYPNHGGFKGGVVGAPPYWLIFFQKAAFFRVKGL